jgi:hypothetical protein
MRHRDNLFFGRHSSFGTCADQGDCTDLVAAHPLNPAQIFFAKYAPPDRTLSLPFITEMDVRRLRLLFPGFSGEFAAAGHHFFGLGGELEHVYLN